MVRAGSNQSIFAAKWRHLALHKCGKNNQIERQPGFSGRSPLWAQKNRKNDLPCVQKLKDLSTKSSRP
jgi:hypothetical protein